MGFANGSTLVAKRITGAKESRLRSKGAEHKRRPYIRDEVGPERTVGSWVSRTTLGR